MFYGILLDSNTCPNLIRYGSNIQKALGLVLLAALAYRTGDITKNHLDRHERPFLCYRDIKIKLVGGKTIENLTVFIAIRNEKGDK